MMWFVAAALWGISEATFFFVVPDVLITATVLRFGLRRGGEKSTKTSPKRFW